MHTRSTPIRAPQPDWAWQGTRNGPFLPTAGLLCTRGLPTGLVSSSRGLPYGPGLSYPILASQMSNLLLGLRLSSPTSSLFDLAWSFPTTVSLIPSNSVSGRTWTDTPGVWGRLWSWGGACWILLGTPWALKASVGPHGHSTIRVELVYQG